MYFDDAVVNNRGGIFTNAGAFMGFGEIVGGFYGVDAVVDKLVGFGDDVRSGDDIFEEFGVGVPSETDDHA